MPRRGPHRDRYGANGKGDWRHKKKGPENQSPFSIIVVSIILVSIILVVPVGGFEPPRPKASDFESLMSTCSITPASQQTRREYTMTQFVDKTIHEVPIRNNG